MFIDLYLNVIDDCLSSHAWSSKPTELLTRSQTVTINFTAQTSAARMVIISLYKIKNILNPSSFDIIESFTMTIYEFNEQDIYEYGHQHHKQEWSNETLRGRYTTYLYIFNLTSRE
ncbi:MAG: hypothetical protein PUD36_11270 [Bacteroidales bacterium]|nr:hypothetical protein [Bacteroidales bacterium]MDY4520325.1 hypothetical protein [Bacteroidales bacterium]